MNQPKIILPLAQLVEMKRQSDKDALFLRMTDQLIKVHKDFLSKLQEVSDTINKKVGPRGDRGLKGDPGEPGDSPDIQKIIKTIQGGIKIPAVPTKEDISSMIEESLPEMPEGFTDTHKRQIISDVFEKLKGEVKIPVIDHAKIAEELIPLMKKKIKVTDLDGHKQTMRALESQLKQGIGYVHGGGDTLAAGTGYTVVKNTDGTTSLVITTSGFTALDATETPNGTLTVFTFPSATAKPSYIISDNVLMKATTKAGTVNWTWDNATKKATMTIPPTDDIEGIK